MDVAKFERDIAPGCNALVIGIADDAIGVVIDSPEVDLPGWDLFIRAHGGAALATINLPTGAMLIVISGVQDLAMSTANAAPLIA